MVFNYSKLKGRIIEKYNTYSDFAKTIGWSKTCLSSKLHGRVAFAQSDVLLMCKLLEIEPNEIGDYFFSAEVQ